MPRAMHEMAPAPGDRLISQLATTNASHVDSVMSVDPRAAAARRIEEHRPGLLVDARRAARLAPGVGERHAPGLLPDEQLAAAVVARGEFDLRLLARLAEVGEREAARAAPPHP